MNLERPPTADAGRGPRVPLAALLVADAISLTGNAMGFVAIPWLVLVFLGALFDAPGATARRSLLPDLVALSGTRLERATGINGAIQRGSLLVGAPIAGVLVAW